MYILKTLQIYKGLGCGWGITVIKTPLCRTACCVHRLTGIEMLVSMYMHTLLEWKQAVSRFKQPTPQQKGTLVYGHMRLR